MTTDVRRLPADIRRRQIMGAALKLAERRGLHAISMAEVAAEAKCSRPLVIRYLGNSEQFKKELLAEAIRTNNLKVIAQGILLKSRACLRLPQEKRAEALAAINA